MRTHVWRKSFVRLSQLHKPLPVQRRHFHPSIRHKTAAASSPSRPPAGGRDGPERDISHLNSDTIKALTQDHSLDDIKHKKPTTRRGRVYAKSSKELPNYPIPNWFLEHNVRLQDPNTTSEYNNSLTTYLDVVDGHGESAPVIITLPLAELESNYEPSSPSSKSSGESSDTSFESPHQPNTFPNSPALSKLATFFSPANLATSSASKSNESNDNPEKSHDSNHKPGKSHESNHHPEKSHESNHHPEKSNDSTTNPPIEDAKRAAKKLVEEYAVGSDLPMLLQVQLLLNATFNITGPASQKLERPNISLYTSDGFAHDKVDRFVEQVANITQADLIRLDANDIAEIAGEHFDSPDYLSKFLASLPYDVYKGQAAINKPSRTAAGDLAQDPTDAEEMDPEDMSPGGPMPEMTNTDFRDLGKFLQDHAEKLRSQLGDTQRGHVAINLSRLREVGRTPPPDKPDTSPTFSITSWDELKLQTLLDTLLDSTTAKRNLPPPGPTSLTLARNSFSTPKPDNSPPASSRMTHLLEQYLMTRLYPEEKDSTLGIRAYDQKPPTPITQSNETEHRTILHIRDLELIRQTPQGEAIVRLLSKVVQRRRKDGQQIVMVGTTAGASPFEAMDDIETEEEEESTFRSLEFVSTSESLVSDMMCTLETLPYHSSGKNVSSYHRLMELNLRNIYNMVRRLGLPTSDSFFNESTKSHLDFYGTSILGRCTLSKNNVQDIVLFAESLRATYTQSPQLETFHIAFGVSLHQNLEKTLEMAEIEAETASRRESAIPTAQPRASAKTAGEKRTPSKVDIEKLKRVCDKYEAKLLGGVVDPSNIKTTFGNVHAAADTKEALQTLTSLSLLRPEAFRYGVLANDRLPGLLLYGPPGTGKTMLAKAVAKDARATVLEVSGAQVHEKYVGEGEKMVKAVFSLAKKLSPCIVFIDEADALFGSRGGSNSRSSHREIINQFLREWDGMDDHSVFMMVATNRPFDLDDAVLRRLPRRLLVDLPMAKDRESILGIHLKEETLDASVSLNKLAEQTALYSGSDLKNVCVSAALAAVREENELLTAHKDDEEFKLPERRTLTGKHFEKALAEISASISEDMSSLSSIRKFDEQFGDRKTKRKKSAYGFGGATEPDEKAARVRQEDPKP